MIYCKYVVKLKQNKEANMSFWTILMLILLFNDGNHDCHCGHDYDYFGDYFD